MMKEIKRVKKAASDEVSERPYIRQPLWVIGLLCVIFGSVGDFAALGFAAQSLCAPVGGFTIVVNVFFGHFWLKESINRRDIFATAMVLLGVVLVAVSADKTQKDFTFDCLLELYKRPVFIVYAVAVVLVCAVLLVFAKYLARLREHDYDSKQYTKLKRIHPIVPAALSGIIGSQSVLFAKCTAEIFKILFTSGDTSLLRHWQAYLIIVCMIATIFSQLHWLAHSLRFFDAVLIVPIFQCFFILGGVIGGAVFFAEFRTLRPSDIVLFLLGLIATMIGVYILSKRDHDPEKDDDDDDDSSPGTMLKNRISVKYSIGSPKLSDDGNYGDVSKLNGNANSIDETTGPRYMALDTPVFKAADGLHDCEDVLGNRNSSRDSTASATPLGLQMGQLSVTDLLMGLKGEVTKVDSIRNSIDRFTLKGGRRSSKDVEGGIGIPLSTRRSFKTLRGRKQSLTKRPSEGNKKPAKQGNEGQPSETATETTSDNPSTPESGPNSQSTQPRQKNSDLSQN